MTSELTRILIASQSAEMLQRPAAVRDYIAAEACRRYSPTAAERATYHAQAIDALRRLDGPAAVECLRIARRQFGL